LYYEASNFNNAFRVRGCNSDTEDYVLPTRTTVAFP